MKMLVVDDTRIILSVIEAILTQDHQEVFTATNGKEGLAAFYDIRPDLVITDIEMPWRDGLSMMQSIRKTHADTSVIYMTGNPGPYQQRLDDEQKNHCAGVLYKPFTRSDLLRAVTDVSFQGLKPHPFIRPLQRPRVNDAPCNHLVKHDMASLSAASFQGERRYEKIDRFFTDGGYFADSYTGSHG
jgi:CheY-like chemotaxis protein